MSEPVSDIAFTKSVKSAQQQRGSRQGYARMEQKGGWQNRITSDLEEFIAQRDSFYFGTASREGQPYIQHRGGPRGFLKVLSDRTLGFADYSGNRQYISVGNLDENNKSFIFLMDYVNRRRIKIWGESETVERDEDLFMRVTDDKGARPERAFLFHVHAWDANCPKFITTRWSEDEIEPSLQRLKSRIVELEKENLELRNRSAS